MFNGGLSKEQLDWLDSVLSSADEKQEKVTIVSKWNLECDFIQLSLTSVIFQVEMQ